MEGQAVAQAGAGGGGEPLDRLGGDADWHQLRPAPGRLDAPELAIAEYKQAPEIKPPKPSLRNYLQRLDPPVPLWRRPCARFHRYAGPFGQSRGRAASLATRRVLLDQKVTRVHSNGCRRSTPSAPSKLLDEHGATEYGGSTSVTPRHPVGADPKSAKHRSTGEVQESVAQQERSPEPGTGLYHDGHAQSVRF